MTVVTRFPPSPTGFMHIGNARTALFNWLFARSQGGKFLLRIEDTDRKRHSDTAVDAIMRDLRWLGLDWDGEAVSQFSRAHRHCDIAKQLVAEGKAYHCYCTPAELEEMREEAKCTGRPTAYDKRWRDRPDTDAPTDIQPVIRIKAPLDGVTQIQDQVQGEVTVNNEQIDDFILLRADGSPTYMLAVVVDDHDMGVTHIIRGDDHLNNAFRQKILIEALGWDTPIYAHTPLIHGSDNKKFSKRHGAATVNEYKELGYLSDAIFNYLLRLGWSHGDDEFINRSQALEWFSLSGLGKSASTFDLAKLENLNAQYINTIDINALIKFSYAFFEEKNITLTEQQKTQIKASEIELKKRSKTLIEFVNEASVYSTSTPLDIDDKAANILKDNIEMLKTIRDYVIAIDSLKPETVMTHFKTLAKTAANGKLGKIGMPLRAALTGKTASISVFEAAAVLGKTEVLTRLNDAITRFT